MKLLFTGSKQTSANITGVYWPYLDSGITHISLENLNADIGKIHTEVMILVVISEGLNTATGRTITIKPSYQSSGQGNSFAPLPYETHVLDNPNSKAACALWLGPYFLWDIPDLRSDFSIILTSSEAGDSSVSVQCYTYSRDITDVSDKVHAADLDAVGGATPMTTAVLRPAIVHLYDDKVHVDYESGRSLYFVRFNTAGQVGITSGASFENWGSGADTYDVALTEVGSGGCRYTASFDTSSNITSKARYSVVVYNQLGGSPADGDTIIGASNGVWSGAKWLTASVALLNKAIQTKATGVIQFYDDADGSVIHTQTPTNQSLTITRTPS